MKVETKCKFCRREIEMEVDQAGFENPAINAETWLKNVACNRCAAFYLAKRQIAEKIGRLCDALIFARKNEKDQAATAIREKLILVTRALCKLICDFRVAQETWDVSFVELLMEQPGKFSKIINSYTTQLNRIIEQARAES